MGVPDPQPPLPLSTAFSVTGLPGQMVEGLAVAVNVNTGGVPGVVKVVLADQGPAVPAHTLSRDRSTYCVPGHKPEKATKTEL